MRKGILIFIGLLLAWFIFGRLLQLPYNPLKWPLFESFVTAITGLAWGALFNEIYNIEKYLKDENN